MPILQQTVTLLDKSKHLGKSLLQPQPTRVRKHHPQPMKMIFLPSELSKIG
jgi:hypothetical protein